MCCELIRVSLNSVEITHKNTMKREPGETDLRTAMADEGNLSEKDKYSINNPRQR